jgi:hypothetical protein
VAYRGNSLRAANVCGFLNMRTASTLHCRRPNFGTLWKCWPTCHSGKQTSICMLVYCINLSMMGRCTYKTSKDKTSKDKTSKDKTSKDKTSTHQNVDTSKRRQIQNVENFFLLAAIHKNEYWFIDHNMKCTVCVPVVIIFSRIFCIYPSRIFAELSNYLSQFKLI